MPNQLVHVRIDVSGKVFLKDPCSSILGKQILESGLPMIIELGMEGFTFRKLAQLIGTTESAIYRYFENKHKLLVYLTAWYWGWLEFQISFHTNNIKDPTVKLKIIIKLLTTTVDDDEQTNYLNESLLHKIVISEGSKAYLTRQVGADNKQEFFKPYKDVCSLIGYIILECNPKYKYPKSLASTTIEMAHFQNYFMNNLPSLTDFGDSKEETAIIPFLNDLVFSSIKG